MLSGFEINTASLNLAVSNGVRFKASQILCVLLMLIFLVPYVMQDN